MSGEGNTELRNNGNGENKEEIKRILQLFESYGPIQTAEIIAAEMAELKRHADKDALTGLDRRDRFADDVRGEIANAIRNNRQLAFLVIDIDNFSQVNNKGVSKHATGDEVLRKITQQLIRGSRKGDRLCRLGGEEVVALLQLNENDALRAAEKWRDNLERAAISYQTDQGETKFLTASFGVAIFKPQADLDFGNITEEYLNQQLNNVVLMADQAMYAAKEAGKNKVGIAKSDGAFAVLTQTSLGKGVLTPVPQPSFTRKEDEYFKLKAR